MTAKMRVWAAESARVRGVSDRAGTSIILDVDRGMAGHAVYFLSRAQAAKLRRELVDALSPKPTGKRGAR